MMNGYHAQGFNGVAADEKPDLLSHKYRPKTSNGYQCHNNQAARLKEWIQDFLTGQTSTNDSDSDGSESGTECSEISEASAKCILLTGPPGVGKTSLVYTIAKELKLHVVESHPAEKRDAKLFSRLRLANQKGKIETNPIMKMFQAITQKQQENKRKRRKLIDNSNTNIGQGNQSLSLSDHSSIILFDDVDIVFDEDGPFLKSLVEFINESKRPVVLTATQYIDQVKSILTRADHIHLEKPYVGDCAALLKQVCNYEKLPKRDLSSKCHRIARRNDCDIRKCLNRIHFYGTDADQINLTQSLSGDIISPDFTKLIVKEQEAYNDTLLNCYTTRSIIDIMDSSLEINDSSTLRQQWIEGRPLAEDIYYSSNRELGIQIREAIINLTSKLYPQEIVSQDEFYETEDKLNESRDRFLKTSSMINTRIRSRIEPPERDFHTDIVPMFSELVSMETKSRPQVGVTNGSRRTRRSLSYIESILIYLESQESDEIARLALKDD